MSRLHGDQKAKYVAAMFGRIVPRYDLVNALMTFGRDRAWRRATVELADPPAGGKALDVATGTGDLAIALANRRTNPNVIALDFSREMLDVAQRKVSLQTRPGAVRCVLGDALALPFPDGTFDCATMGFGMRNVADITRALAEIHRVLEPGGRFVNLELTMPSTPIWASLFRVYFYRVVPLLGGLVSGDLEAYAYLPHSLTHFPHAAQLAAVMQTAGFQPVNYRLYAGGIIAIHLGTKSPHQREGL